MTAQHLHAPSREFMVRQACLNVMTAGSWRFFMTPEHEEWVRENEELILSLPRSAVSLVRREFNKLAAHYRTDEGE